MARPISILIRRLGIRMCHSCCARATGGCQAVGVRSEALLNAAPLDHLAGRLAIHSQPAKRSISMSRPLQAAF